MLNAADQELLYQELLQKRRDYYTHESKLSPKYAADLKGWLNRVDEFPQSL